MDNQSVKIVKAEPVGAIQDIGADAAKDLPSHCRFRYMQTIEYTLENGTAQHGTEKALTKPKLKNAIERLKGRVSAGKVYAEFTDGKFWGTKHVY